MPIPAIPVTVETSHKLPLFAIAEGVRMWVEKHHVALGIERHDLPTLSLRFSGEAEHDLEVVVYRTHTLKMPS